MPSTDLSAFGALLSSRESCRFFSRTLSSDMPRPATFGWHFAICALVIALTGALWFMSFRFRQLKTVEKANQNRGPKSAPKKPEKPICRMKLLARSLRRVMVGNQPPAPLLLYPHPGKASVTGNSLAFVLSNHC